MFTLTGLGKGVRVNTSLNPIVRKSIAALAKKMDAPQTVVINSLCAEALKANGFYAATATPAKRKVARRASTTTTTAKRKR